MKRISYADTVVGTAPEVADLVMEYAAQLARTGSADTVTIPACSDDGEVQQVTLLLGPASQIEVVEDDAPFECDAADAVDDLRRRLGVLTTVIPQSDEAGPSGFGDFDDVGGVAESGR